MSNITLNPIYEKIIDDLSNQKYSISDFFFSTEETKQLREAIIRKENKKDFHQAAVGSSVNEQIVKSIRGDKIRWIDEENKTETNDQKLLRLGLFSALALSIHNFPEGLATFLSALENPTYGISIASAIAIHNIPEGIAVAIPIYYATKNRKKAFLYSFLSGLTEPIGALIGYFVLLQFFDESIFGAIFASVAGMMVYISINELIPTANEYAGKKLSTYGIVIGMFVMAVSLVLFM